MNYMMQGDCYDSVTLHFIHLIWHFDEEFRE